MLRRARVIGRAPGLRFERHPRTEPIEMLELAGERRCSALASAPKPESSEQFHTSLFLLAGAVVEMDRPPFPPGRGRGRDAA